MGLPFVVIGGFLGAGKTTLLNHWLRESSGRRLAVLVNDFGALDIDAERVAAAGGAPIALSNGCVCCTIGDDLSAALTRVLALRPEPEAVIVEASGVADPWRIAQYAVADPGLTLQAVLVIVDASCAAAQAADPLLADTLARPLAHADLVLLNKADLAEPAALQAARAWIDAHASAPVLETTQAALPWAVVGDSAPHVARGGWPAPAAHGDRFEAWSIAPDAVYGRKTLRAWVRSLPSSVLRLKALLPVRDGWVELQWAGRRGHLRTVQTPHGGPAVVAIGLRGQLPTALLAQGLADCVDAS